MVNEYFCFGERIYVIGFWRKLVRMPEDVLALFQDIKQYRGVTKPSQHPVSGLQLAQGTLLRSQNTVGTLR